ncbi:MAG: hypothetical protein V4590_10485 [Bacteroidota bacterium]
MKIIAPYIAIFLTVLFAATLLPYNALHQHAEDEHTAAMVNQEHDPAHHCELDEQFCQSAPETDCGHDMHIAKTHPKCFACDFSFIKSFEASSDISVYKEVSVPSMYKELNTTTLNKDFIFVGNKGPPAIA